MQSRRVALTPDPVLVVGATLRLTRLVVTDDIGLWYIKTPARRWASTRNGEPDPSLKRERLVSGLDCPFCVGFWIALLTLGLVRLSHRSRLLRLILTALALNELTAHVGARLGDVAGEDADEWAELL